MSETSAFAPDAMAQVWFVEFDEQSIPTLVQAFEEPWKALSLNRLFCITSSTKPARRRSSTGADAEFS
jgi:hypothetical protein